MAGATLHYKVEIGAARKAFQHAAAGLADPASLYRVLGEALLPTQKGRFLSMTDPEGNRWAPLSPKYQKRKKYNRDKIGTLRGYLGHTLRYQADADGLALGSNLKYAARFQFGGEFQIAARSQRAYFKQNKDGSVGRRFVSKRKSNFAQNVTLRAHTIKQPARAALGISASDRVLITDTSVDWLAARLSGR